MKIIHYFNPGHEYTILNREPSYTLPANISLMMRELSSLPMWYADVADIVLVDDCFDKSYYDFLIEQGFNIPKVLFQRELKIVDNNPVECWGLSPRGIRFVEGINKKYHLNLLLPTWDDQFIYLSSRMMSRDILSSIVESDSYFDFIELPQFYTNLESIEAELGRRNIDLLAKSPFSSSGRGLLRLFSSGLGQSEKQILSGMLNKQEQLSIEPIYNRKLDFAMEFMSSGSGDLTFEGYSLFVTNEKGAYRGNHLLSQCEIETKIQDFISPGILSSVKDKLINLLTQYYGAVYKGCIGVDMMIVECDGDYKLHPCVEINMRYNMGYLSLRLFDQFVCSAEGDFHLEFDGSGTLLEKHKIMENEYPLVVHEGKIRSGYLSLCPINEKSKYRAYVLIQ